MKPVLLLLLLLVHHSTAAPPPPPGNEPPPADYVVTANEAGALRMPMRAGNIPDPASLTQDDFGRFSKSINFCGKLQISTDALKTEMELAYRKPKSFDLRIDCTPHPERVVVSSKANDLKAPTSTEPADLSKCIGTNICTNDVTSPVNAMYGTAALSATVPAPESNVCKSLPGQVIFSNEGSCVDITAEYGISTSSSPDQRSFSRWLGDKKRFRIIRPFHFKGVGNTPKADLMPWTNSFLPPPPAQSYSFQKCHGTCEFGAVFRFIMNPASWKMMIYLKSTSKGFKMCISPDNFASTSETPKCKRSGELYVLPQLGVVVWPGTGRASLLQMKTDEYGPNDVFAIEVGYGLEEDKNADGSLPSEFYVGNTYRQYVSSDGIKFSATAASKIALFFETEENDLQSGGGIVVPYAQSGETWYKTDNPLFESEVPTVQSTGSKTNGDEEVPIDRFLNISAKIPFTSTEKPNDQRWAVNARDQMSDNKSDAMYTPGKWWTWGIFIGFVIGSLLGMAILGGIFYVLRRTVYGFWYRGMYKRYGCDASGTTGGITGIGFGQTTTGAITLSKTAADKGGTTGGTTGMTTGGTTGGGTTMGGTTGGTTGKTSGSSSTTGSTIAM